MANPRKFSEKIALQKQKQAEGTAEFEKIMREVSDATSKQEETSYNQRMSECGISHNGSNSATHVHRESRGRSVGVGPMRTDRKVDISPYSSGTYLSPPPNDLYSRRASSDSAILQSLIQTSEKHHGSHSPISLSPTAQRRSVYMNTSPDHRHLLNSSPNRNFSNVDIRQVSSGLSRLPCGGAYQSSHDGSLSAPIGNNTGSLPDLTSVHFASPLNTPLDKEQEHSSSPYSSSPITTPTTLSPTSMPNRYHYSPAHSPSDSNTYSPTHFSSNARQTYLTVPGNHNSNHQFSNKDAPFDSNQYNASDIGQTTHLSFTNLPGLIHLPQNNIRNSNISNNNTLHSSHGNLSSIGIAVGNITEYRNPQCRPSPGSSPGLTPSIPTSDSNPSAPCSPVPQNPSSSSSSSQTYDKFQSQNNDGYNLNQSFQSTFEQFSLVDNSTPEYIPNLQSSQNNYGSLQFDDSTFAQLDSLTNSSQQLQPINRDNYSAQDLNHMNKNESNSRFGTNSNIISQSAQHLAQEAQNTHHQNNYQAPNTPTSIPEIIFSDFSSGNPEFSREIFGSLDLELGPMDVAGLQMLSDPNSTMIADPTIEDSFRRDLN